MNIIINTVKLKFLHKALVLVNAYKCAKFQLPSSISYWGMEGVPKWKLGAADFLRRPLADKFLHVAIVHANAYQRNFNFLDPLVSEIWGGSQRKKWELPISPDAL